MPWLVGTSSCIFRTEAKIVFPIHPEGENGEKNPLSPFGKISSDYRDRLKLHLSLEFRW